MDTIAGTAMAQQGMASQPTLSVVVPVYNSTADLKHCLAALAASEFRDFEVLVVDDGSTEPVKPSVDEFGFSYVRIAGPGGPARARNRGVALVRGRYVVFVDADVCVHKDALTHFASAFAADPKVEAVIGSYDDAPAKPNFVSQYKNLFHHYVHQEAAGEVITFWSGCGAMRRDLFLEFGGFDEQRYRRPAIEDIELGTWLSAAGHKIVLDSRIVGKHRKRWTIRNLLTTDIFDRGVPWTRLMLRAGKIANTLNVKPVQRISVALAFLSVLLAPAAIWWPAIALVSLALAVAVTILNLNFYRFFLKRSGLWFTLRVVPLHWLYFGCCGVSVILGTLLHYLEKGSTEPAMPLRTDMPNNRTASEIELTIIVAVVGGKALVRRCLAAICSQVNFANTEVIVPYDCWSADVEDLAEEFPPVRLHFINDLGAASSATVSSHQHRLYDRRRAIGLSLARGRLIAMTEDYAVPAEDWCRQIFRAHEQPYAVIGGAIDNGIDRPLNWALYYCDFGRYGNPLERGPAEYASDVNIAYKREALDSIHDVWCEAYHETTVHWTLRSRGEVVFLDPTMVVYQHRPAMGVFRAVRERIEWGRIFAETRVARCSLWRRLCYAAGTAILPALLLLRVLRHMLRQSRSTSQIVKTLPLTACLLAGWALGELSGYLGGPDAVETSLTETRTGKLTTSQP